MTASTLSRLIVTAIAAGQGFSPIFIDLNRTHATNPLWPGHARFHLVQQVLTLFPAALVELGLLWYPGPALRARFYLVSLLTATPLAGVLLAVLFRRVYGGALHDPNGIQPLRFRFGSRHFELHGNLLLVVLAAVLLAAAVLIFRSQG